jgi:hypothetical protein
LIIDMFDMPYRPNTPDKSLWIGPGRANPVKTLRQGDRVAAGFRSLSQTCADIAGVWLDTLDKREVAEEEMKVRRMHLPIGQAG